jgi:hypothetical protein
MESGVKRKSPEEGHRTLGFQISGDGKCNAQKKAMKEKTILCGEAIRSSTMWRGESSMAYNAFYMPSLGYGTPATTLSMKDCEEIQRPVVNTILPKMGIARTAPISVVFGTAQYEGLGLTHLCRSTRSYTSTISTGAFPLRRRYRATHANATGIYAT